MSPRPHDFNPEEEQEVYDLFSTLRREVYDAIKDLATRIFARIDLQQGEDERVEQPDVLKIIEQSLINLLQVIIQLFQGGSDDAPPLLPDDSRDDDESTAIPPIVRRPRHEQEDE